MTGPSADVFFRNFLPFTTGTLYGIYGDELTTTNFSFNNIVVGSGLQGNIVLNDIPSGRWRMSYQVFRSDTTAVSLLTAAVVSRTNIYFNWNAEADFDFMYDSTENSEYDTPTGPGSLLSTTTNGNYLFECYFTSLGSGDLTMSFSRASDYATNTGTAQNALFTIMKVGPVATAGSMTDNFVDDEIAGGPPPG